MLLEIFRSEWENGQDIYNFTAVLGVLSNKDADTQLFSILRSIRFIHVAF